MIVNRTVVFSGVEPAPLSFRAAMGMQTTLNVSFLRSTGVPYDADVSAQLQLTGRTTARAATYVMPATDIVNGRARATIPAGDLDDGNGWQLRLFGKIGGEPALLAVGTVMPIAAGMAAASVDEVDLINLRISRGQPFKMFVLAWVDTGKSAPEDLAATTIAAFITTARNGTPLTAFTVTSIDGNEIELDLTQPQVDDLPDNCWWTLIASTSEGATTWAEGTVTVLT